MSRREDKSAGSVGSIGAKRKNFALIGAAGFVAPRHIEAIHAVGGDLVAATDPHDSVGILDRHFPGCRYFREFERFDRFCSREAGNGKAIDYVVICSPNYLHDAHCRFALRLGADAICEKPLCLTERNLDELAAMEEKTGRRVWNILQLRLNRQLQDLRCNLDSGYHQASVTYHTPRGAWYLRSWKGDEAKSGGVGVNIGVHLFDLLTWLFGNAVYTIVSHKTPQALKGGIQFEKAGAVFDLSIEPDHAPYRQIVVDDQELEMSQGFTDLHTESYQQILCGHGFGVQDARKAIALCERLNK